MGGFPAAPGAQDAVTNATAEIAAAADFPLVRLMTVGQLYESPDLAFTCVASAVRTIPTRLVGFGSSFFGAVCLACGPLLALLALFRRS